MTYYEIGTIINERKTWESKYIQTLANDLKEYGNSYSSRNLHYMAQFSTEFKKNEIMHQPGAQIPWFTLVEISHQLGGQIPWRTIIGIMSKSSSHEEMIFNFLQLNGLLYISKNDIILTFESWR